MSATADRPKDIYDEAARDLPKVAAPVSEVPKMTEKHVESLEASGADLLDQGCDLLAADVAEVESLVRSLASGERVVVSRADLIDYAASLENAAELMGDEFPNSASICAANAKEIRARLTPPSEGSQL
jgi:hypothetical protein